MSSRAAQVAVRDTARKVFPALADWWTVLDRAGICDDDAVKIAAAAERHGTSVGAEAVALGYLTPRKLAAAMAEDLDLGMQSEVEPDSLVLSDDQAAALLRIERPTTLVKISDGAETRFLVATVELDRL